MSCNASKYMQALHRHENDLQWKKGKLVKKPQNQAEKRENAEFFTKIKRNLYWKRKILMPDFNRTFFCSGVYITYGTCVSVLPFIRYTVMSWPFSQCGRKYNLSWWNWIVFCLNDYKPFAFIGTVVLTTQTTNVCDACSLFICLYNSCVLRGAL